MAVPLPISVVIPAFNAAGTLAEALASVAAQTQRPFETIVVDDGSSDATPDIARAHGARVVSQPNAGSAVARNTGIAAAETPWIALLDADDRWHPERLEVQWRALARRPDVAIVASEHSRFGVGFPTVANVLASTPQYRRMPRSPLGDESVFVTRGDVLRAIVHGFFVLPSTLLVARRLFVDEDGLFESRDRLPAGPDFAVGEDYEWFLRVLRHSDVVFVERALVEYRLSTASQSASGGGMRLGDAMLGTLVRQRPERYAEGAAAAFARVRTRQLRESALRHLAVGEVAPAQAVFARLAGERDALGSVLAVVLGTGLGRAAFGVAWRIWRHAIRPRLRPGTVT